MKTYDIQLKTSAFTFRLTCVLAVILSLLTGSPAAAEVEEYFLDVELKAGPENGQVADSVTAVRYYVIRAENPGPVVFITAGIHGDEPAGVYAACKLARLNPSRGELYIFPLLNLSGFKQNSRYFLNGIDLNRCFPGEKESNSGEKLASALFNLIGKKGDVVIDLHESRYFLQQNNKYLGQSIIAGVMTDSVLYALHAVDKLNRDIEKEIERFTLLGHPVKHSLVCAADRYLKIPSFIVETCQQNSLPERVNFQLKVVEYLLNELGVQLYESDG